MSITSKMQLQGSNPTGVLGKLIGILMNKGHINIYKWALNNIDINQEMNVLDIGCGGGKLLNILSHMIKSGKICGIDHSSEMVKLAKRVNSNKETVEVKQASVSKIPYSDNSFDVVASFETIQFWSNIPTDLKEIKRILKNSAVLLIINRYPKENSKWINLVKLKSKDEYKKVLVNAGFKDIYIDIKSKKGWILVKAI